MNAPSHVLMTADAVGGVWTYSLELSRALARHGTRVTLATMGPRPSDAQRAAASLVPNLELVESDYALEWMDRPWADVDAAGQWLLDLAESVRPDVVHINGFAHGALSWTRPTIVVAHSCVVSWWNAVLGEDPPDSWAEYRERVRAGLLGGDAVVAVSRAMAESLMRHYEFHGAHVVLNGRWATDYRPGDKEPVVLTSGRVWDAAKNIAALDRAAGRLRWPVYVAGDTKTPHGGDAVLSDSQPLGLLAPAELRDWFSRASIYALPALYEPFGLSVLEAALSGCALVLGDIPSQRELWDHAAMFADPRDSDAIAAAVNRLISDDRLRCELAGKARVRGLSLTPDRMANAYIRLYAHACAQQTANEEAAATCAL